MEIPSNLVANQDFYDSMIHAFFIRLEEILKRRSRGCLLMLSHSSFKSTKSDFLITCHHMSSPSSDDLGTLASSVVVSMFFFHPETGAK